MCHMLVRRPNLEDASQPHYINTAVALLSCSAWKYVLILMIKKEKTFFHLVTTFTMLWLTEKKYFIISHCVHFTIIKREKSFFHLVTTIATPWSRQMFFFHLVIAFTKPWSRQKNFFFFESLRSLHHDQDRKSFLSFSHYVYYTMVKRGKCFFYLVTIFATPWSTEKCFFHFSTTFATP